MLYFVINYDRVHCRRYVWIFTFEIASEYFLSLELKHGKIKLNQQRKCALSKIPIAHRLNWIILRKKMCGIFYYYDVLRIFLFNFQRQFDIEFRHWYCAKYCWIYVEIRIVCKDYFILLYVDVFSFDLFHLFWDKRFHRHFESLSDEPSRFFLWI